MSEVISFRLDKNNPREARALMILRRLQGEGQNIRYIITEAILSLEHSHDNKFEPEIFHALSEKLDIVTGILDQLSNGREIHNDWISDSNQSNMNLPSNFIDSIKANAKTGFKMGNPE